MSSKFDQPFIEVTTRYFIPLGSDLLGDIEKTSLAEIMREVGNVSKFEPKRKKTETPENKKP